MTTNTYVLDNEVSQTLTDAMTTENVTYQLVPPQIHRDNLVEYAIQNVKNYFKDGLATMEPDFLL